MLERLPTRNELGVMNFDEAVPGVTLFLVQSGIEFMSAAACDATD